MTQQTPAILPPITDPGVHDQIDRLARRYVEASGLGIELLNSIGATAEGLITRVPDSMRQRLDRITLAALNRALDAASGSRRVLRERGDWFNRLAASVSGAAGGVAGLPGAVVEMPITITLLLRAILDIAAEHGLDPNDDRVRAMALQVLATAGPLTDDDGADLGMLAARMSITGSTLQTLIARIAPRLSAAMGQKLAAQATPVLGAFAGASINFVFTRYYQDMARVQFGLMRLADETGLPREALIERLQIAIDALHDRRAVKRA